MTGEKCSRRGSGAFADNGSGHVQRLSRRQQVATAKHFLCAWGCMRCRYNLTEVLSEVGNRIPFKPLQMALAARYNIAPMQNAAAVLRDGEDVCREPPHPYPLSRWGRGSESRSPRPVPHRHEMS